MRRDAGLWPALLGGGMLAAVWLGPLPDLARSSFTAHMIMHLGVVAVAAPPLGMALASLIVRYAGPQTFARLAVAASAFELGVVWFWHAPSLHEIARWESWALVAEQASFLVAGVAVWTAALAGRFSPRALVSGIFALFLTSMHMTLLGAILALSNRTLYPASCLGGSLVEDPLLDQQAGGALMLGVGGAVYLLGGLWLLSRLLRGAGNRAEPFALDH